MIEIIPAIIPESLEDLREKLSLVQGLTSSVQIDFVDGVYVENKAWPYKEGQGKEWEKLVSETEGLPFWEDFFFEADLMVADAEKKLADVIYAGFGRVILHPTSGGNIREMIEMARTLDTEVGIALRVDSNIDDFLDFIEKADFVQVMGIENPGSQGEPFDERALTQVRALRTRFPRLIISVDGGVNEQNAPLLISAGADRLVSGSAIFGSGDTKGVLARMNESEDRAEEIFE